jgi:FSR family fosmidomycin resistance protein-like MFS transporter
VLDYDPVMTAVAHEAWRADVRTISLVGVAHGTSHFFHLLLPPLFPFFVRDFGVSYAQLGLLVTMFFVVSGVGQALSGFIVDRFGARPALFTALSCFVLAGVSGAMAQGLGGLVLTAALAGIGNAPFHPVDFTILNRRVSKPRLGHAFSVHGITGNLGWASAPVVLLGVTSITGQWRHALLVAALLAALALALSVWQRDALGDDHALRRADRGGAAPGHALAFLRLPSVWLCFSFFFWSTAALAAVQSFAGPALQRIHGLALEVGAYAVTGFTLFGALGMVMGGFISAKVPRLERVIALGLTASAVLLAMATLPAVGGIGALVLASLAGFGAGLAGPSRDMLIRRAAPPGATGRVYGTVYSGLDLGFALAAPTFGVLLDRDMPAWVFLGAAAALMFGVASAGLVARRVSVPNAAAVHA